MLPQDTLNTRKTLTVQNKSYSYYCLKTLEKSGFPEISKLPFSLKILLENLLRHEDGKTVTIEDIKNLASGSYNKTANQEIAFKPARVLMQDFTGVPAIVDLAAMRDAIKKRGGDPLRINPLTPVDLVIDHSVQVDVSGEKDALRINTQLEMERNQERYQFLKWGQKAFKNFRVVPPGTGICHQINLEYLAKTVWTQTLDNETLAYPDTVVGTDSHTTMINGLGVLGWGVGGIEAEAAMLGQPISMLIPEVVGVKLMGTLRPGINATDLVLAVTHLLRQKGVVGKFVEYFGSGIASLSLADRATLANMAPEYGATCGFFPIDRKTMEYLQLTGRDRDQLKLVEAYAKAQGLWYEETDETPNFSDIVEIDLASIQSYMAGPKRPQDRIPLSDVTHALHNAFPLAADVKDANQLTHGSVVIAAITSCTNTSNSHVMLAAGLLAKKAFEKNLKPKPWVKTSLAPGSTVVTRYLEETQLQTYLDKLGFNVVGYGCTTCIGNSGPIADEIAEQITQNNLVVSAVLSGNRNFEGRINPFVKANWLASPPLVVAFAIAGTTQIDLTQDPLGYDEHAQPVFLKDIWPTSDEITAATNKITEKLFKTQYAHVFLGSPAWQGIKVSDATTFPWQEESTYIQDPPYFINTDFKPRKLTDIKSARILALLGDSITTDHISPAGSIKKESPAGMFLLENGVPHNEFNSLGARRGNHKIMMRGTFANIRLKNEMLKDIEGGFTKYIPTGETLSIFDAAMRYQQHQVPLIIIAGKEYGTGSSRDWAAKGPKLLGVEVVIAESFERIHRTNLIGMGILPLQFEKGITRQTLALTGEEEVDILGFENPITPHRYFTAKFKRANGESFTIQLLSRIDTYNEAEYYLHGGILPFVLSQM